MKRKWPLLANLAFLFSLGDALASADMDRKFALHSLGALRPVDNVDGIFNESVKNAFGEYFQTQTRFTVQDISSSDKVIEKSKIPYSQAIEDAEVLLQIAKTFRVDSFIRTKILKEGNQYRFIMDWLHMPKAQILQTESFLIDDPSAGMRPQRESVRDSVIQGLDRLVSKFPFFGMVTGRDGNNVTIQIGNRSQIRVGDTLVFSSLEEVKFHPLTKVLVEWVWSTTGRAKVESIDNGLAFCEIEREESGKTLGRYQKVTQILQRPEAPYLPSQFQEAEPRKEEERPFPMIGFGALGPLLGGYSREVSAGTAGNGWTGSGFFYGSAAQGQLWLLQDWFADMQIRAGLFKYSQTEIFNEENVSSNMSGSFVEARIAAGYSFWPRGIIHGARGWLRAGYHTTKFGLTAISTNQTGPTYLTAFFVGAGGEVPVRSFWGIMGGADIGVFKSAQETIKVINSPISSTTDLLFSFGVFYRPTPWVAYRFGLDGTIVVMEFENSTQLTQKVIAFAPSVVFYF